MGNKIKFVLLLTSIVVALVGVALYFILKDGEVPRIPDNQYWGPGSGERESSNSIIQPFQINISEDVLTDLRTRLTLEMSSSDARIVDTMEGIGFEYGLSKTFLSQVTSYWLNEYDWREREKLLNKYPNFKTKISGIDIHFQHVVSSGKQSKLGTRTLLLLHGWPGSFTEYQPLIALLVDPKIEWNLNLVIPSLPGFGFSESSSKPGLGAAEMTPILLNLMKRLGYEQFYVQGGDWGSILASNLATLYPKQVQGIHMTLCHSLMPRAMIKFGMSLIVPQVFMDEAEIAMYNSTSVFDFLINLIRETGYLHIQATKPDTIGVALSHSPSGFAAYILEKYSFWTNSSLLHLKDGGILDNFNLDALLDIVMVHWLGKSVSSSMRIYKETLNYITSNQLDIERVPVDVPTSCFHLPGEPLSLTRFALMSKYSNLRYTTATTGGHFNALEIPQLLANDILAALSHMELMTAKLNRNKK